MKKIDKFKITVLLINDKPDEVEEIKNYLTEAMRFEWHLMHCVNLKEASSRIQKADVIILSVGLEGLPTPKDIFRNVDRIALEKPIIVTTGKNSTGPELATYVMEKGAADVIVRGQFGRLVDAIEFSLIRQKITSSDRKASDLALEQKDEKSAADLQASENRRAAEEEKSRQILSMFSGSYSVDKEQT